MNCVSCLKGKRTPFKQPESNRIGKVLKAHSHLGTILSRHNPISAQSYLLFPAIHVLVAPTTYSWIAVEPSGSEIDLHEEMFGKRADEIVYGDECPLCHTRIDEIGWCGCDTIGGG